MIYLDSSVLLPFYRTEALSQQVQHLLNTTTAPVIITELTLVEFASALARWTRTKELAEEHAIMIEQALHADINNHCFLVKPLHAAIYQQAKNWLAERKTALKTFDALHLASSFLLKSKLITADNILASAANTLSVPAQLIRPLGD